MTNSTLVPVWDPLVRIFHWSLVATFLASWWTQQDSYNLHLQMGYATLGLTCLRIVWGGIGPGYARFSDFIYSPRTTISYIGSLLHGHAKRYIGHNPAAAAMIVALLAGLIIVTISGIALDGAENWSGPMSQMNLYRYKSLIHSTHVASTDVLLILIVLHLLGVLASSLIHRENLVKAMMSGYKRKH